jgi:hypothetical protein
MNGKSPKPRHFPFLVCQFSLLVADNSDRAASCGGLTVRFLNENEKWKMVS